MPSINDTSAMRFYFFILNVATVFTVVASTTYTDYMCPPGEQFNGNFNYRHHSELDGYVFHDEQWWNWSPTIGGWDRDGTRDYNMEPHDCMMFCVQGWAHAPDTTHFKPYGWNQWDPDHTYFFGIRVSGSEKQCHCFRDHNTLGFSRSSAGTPPIQCQMSTGVCTLDTSKFTNYWLGTTRQWFSVTISCSSCNWMEFQTDYTMTETCIDFSTSAYRSGNAPWYQYYRDRESAPQPYPQNNHWYSYCEEQYNVPVTHNSYLMFGITNPTDTSPGSCFYLSRCNNGKKLVETASTFAYGQISGSSCANCDAGQYKSGYNYDRGCSGCPSYTYSTGGATACSNWISCGDGQYISGASTTSYGSCASCQAGTYKAGTSNQITSCTSCPSYTYSTGGATACSDWISCGDGQYISGASSTSYGSCANCGTGQYKAGTSNQITSCSTCAAQTFALGGATACTPWTECPAGSYNTINSIHQDSTCGLCGAGTFTASANRLTSCDTCPSGTFTTAQGTTECQAWTVTSCPEGQEVLDGTASTDSYCNDCVAGKAKAGTNGDACSPCEAGSFSTGGAAVCTPWKTCSKGESYAAGSATADATCTPCEAGTFQGNDGSTATTCSPCEAGTFSAEGADACTPWKTCNAGEFRTAGSATADATCTLCEAGTFQGNDGSTATTCSPCEAGTFSAEGADACTPWKTCDAGEFRTAGNATADATCTPCPAGEYQPDSSSTATSCLPCSNTSEYSTGGAATCTSTLASCDKGYRFVDGLAVAENQCIACDPGYAQPDDSTRVIQCTPCPAGEFQDQPASDNCDDCPAAPIQAAGQLLSAQTRPFARRRHI